VHKRRRKSSQDINRDEKHKQIKSQQGKKGQVGEIEDSRHEVLKGAKMIGSRGTQFLEEQRDVPCSPNEGPFRRHVAFPRIFFFDIETGQLVEAQ